MEPFFEDPNRETFKELLEANRRDRGLVQRGPRRVAVPTIVVTEPTPPPQIKHPTDRNQNLGQLRKFAASKGLLLWKPPFLEGVWDADDEWQYLALFKQMESSFGLDVPAEIEAFKILDVRRQKLINNHDEYFFYLGGSKKASAASRNLKDPMSSIMVDFAKIKPLMTDEEFQELQRKQREDAEQAQVAELLAATRKA